MISLQQPLAFFDLETTGLDITNDRIVEIAIVKMNPDGSQEQYERRINPEMRISEESSAIHGISNEMVKDAPTFSQIAHEVASFIGNADLAGYNSNKFDIPVLAEEFLRVGHSFDVGARKFVDVQNIFHKMEQRTLAAAFQFYCKKELINAHSALADIEATQEVFLAQLGKYDSLEKTISFLAEFSRQGDYKLLDFAGRIAENKNGEAIYNFGKHKGKTIAEVMQLEPGYYGWMLSSNFPLYTKKVLKEAADKLKLAHPKGNEQSKEKTAQNFEQKLDALKQKFGK